MAVRIRLFFDQLESPITQMFDTNEKNFIPLDDSTQQDISPETRAIRVDVRFWKYCYFKKH